MNTHKFVATSMKEALAKVKEELGEDALILKSEKVKAGGALTFAKRELIEVTAATPDEVKADVQSGPEFAATFDRTLSQSPMSENPPRTDADLSQLKDEVSRIREDLGEIGKYFRYNNLPHMPRELTRIWESLGKSGMDGQWASDLAQEALVQLRAEELVSSPAIEEYFLSRLARVVKPSPQLPLRRTTAYKIALIGPPGAGKTTLLQKLASDPQIYGKRKIGLLSIDTHRMAAVEQLRAFARIAGASLEVVFQPSQCPAALNRLAACEVILIDTFGCSVSESDRLQELKSFIDHMDPDEIQLVMNSSVRDEDLIRTIRRFREVGVTHLSFTRLDESLRYGFLLNVIRKSERPVAWLSRGQGFVGCTERFTPEHLRRWIAQSEPLPEVLPDMDVPLTRVTN
jgi:flagellar biosynthesis protein FlhF